MLVTPDSIFLLSKMPGYATECLNQSLTALVEFAEGKQTELIPDKMQGMLTGKAKAMKNIGLLSFDEVRLSLAELVKCPGLTLDPALLLGKQANGATEDCSMGAFKKGEEEIVGECLPQVLASSTCILYTHVGH